MKIVTDYESELKQKGVLHTTTTGDSMAPLLKNHQSVVRYRPKTGRLNKWDVPLVKRPDGTYVLHRIVKVLPSGYLTCGDNRRKNDPPVMEEEVIGVMDGYYKGETFVSVSDRSYRTYVFFWGRPNPIRYLWILGKECIFRVKKKFFTKSK